MALIRGWRSFQIFYFLLFKDSRNQEKTHEIDKFLDIIFTNNTINKDPRFQYRRRCRDQRQRVEIAARHLQHLIQMCCQTD